MCEWHFSDQELRWEGEIWERGRETCPLIGYYVLHMDCDWLTRNWILRGKSWWQPLSDCQHLSQVGDGEPESAIRLVSCHSGSASHCQIHCYCCTFVEKYLIEGHSSIVLIFFLSFARISAINPTQNVTFYFDLNNNNITGTQQIWELFYVLETIFRYFLW